VRELFIVVLAATCLVSAAPQEPKLVLFIVVDQCRYDYLTRFRDEFHGGFNRLLENGAFFASARVDFFPTLTAPGHAAMLSGASPSASGIVGNDWFDTAPDCRLMHCLPVRRNSAIADEALDSTRSVVQREASNRLPVQMAVLHRLLRS